MEYKDLNPAQAQAIDNWWNEQNIEYDCQDNERYAVIGNVESLEDYDRRQMNGCCGFVDVELECSDGSTVLFGFNYGH